MSETTADTATEETPTETATGDTSTVEQLQAELDKWKATSRKHEDRAKANATAQKQLDDLKQASMTDLEKAVAEAKDAGRAEALSQAGAKIARAEFKAALKDRLDDEGFEALMSGLDLKAFLDDDGDVDAKKIAAFVDRVSPRATEQTLAAVDLGQGKRTTSDMALNGDPILETVKQKLGIR